MLPDLDAASCGGTRHDGTVVTVRYWAGARAAAGREEEAVEASTVGELLGAIGGRTPHTSSCEAHGAEAETVD